jgi:hypothetical protein
MQTTLKPQQGWAPGMTHVLAVTLVSISMTVAVLALPVATGFLVQELSGGPATHTTHGPIPEPGLDR